MTTDRRASAARRIQDHTTAHNQTAQAHDEDIPPRAQGERPAHKSRDAHRRTSARRPGRIKDGLSTQAPPPPPPQPQPQPPIPQQSQQVHSYPAPDLYSCYPLPALSLLCFLFYYYTYYTLRHAIY